MSHQDREGIPEELGRIAELLRNQRPQEGPLELDRIKLRVMRSRRGPVLLSGKGNGYMRSRLVGVLIVIGMLGGGAGALAAKGGLPVKAFDEGKQSANSQYCPPTSQNPGALKGPGVNCGNPKTKKKHKKNVKSKSCHKSKSKKHSKSRKHKAKKSADAFADKKKHGKRHHKSRSCSKSKKHSKSKGHGKGKKK
jgi:hypothetical protein